MTDQNKKDLKAQKRQSQVQELYTIFTRSYEMARAWGGPQRKAFDNAFNEVNKRVDELCKAKPQESSFILGCRSDAKDLIVKRVTELESQVVKYVKPRPKTKA